MGINETDIRRIVWAFLEAFVATAYTLATGLGRFPNLNEAQAIIWGALIGALAATISFVKNFILPDGSTLK